MAADDDELERIAPRALQPLIVFDGDCVLCSRSLRLLARIDRKRLFRLTTAQGECGQALYRYCGLPTDDFATYLVIADGRVFQRSSAVLAIARRLGWPWKAALALAIVPRPLRDAAYNLIARHRYRIFGHSTACALADARITDRLV